MVVEKFCAVADKDSAKSTPLVSTKLLGCEEQCNSYLHKLGICLCLSRTGNRKPIHKTSSTIYLCLLVLPWLGLCRSLITESLPSCAANINRHNPFSLNIALRRQRFQQSCLLSSLRRAAKIKLEIEKLKNYLLELNMVVTTQELVVTMDYGSIPCAVQEDLLASAVQVHLAHVVRSGKC